LEKGPNIKPLPPCDALADTLEGPVLIKVGDDISTDTIMPAISQFVFEPIDPTYATRALAHQHTGSFIVGGRNYGQGSSREHATSKRQVAILLAESVINLVRHWHERAWS